MDKLLILIIMIVGLASFAYADSNGIWIDASDIRGGTFGSDESPTSFTFNVPVNLGFGVTYDGLELDSRFVNTAEGDSITSPMIVDSTIISQDILDGTITSADVADNTITSADVTDNTIASIDIRDNSILSADIFDGTITSVDILDNSILSADILDNTIVAADLAPSSVGGPELVIGYRDGIVYDTRFVNAGELNSITSSMVVDESLTSADLGPNSVGSSELSDNLDGNSLFFNTLTVDTIIPRSGNTVVIQLS